jgi:hypothetical protein
MRMEKRKGKEDCALRTGRKMGHRHEAGKVFGFLSVATFGDKTMTTSYLIIR